MLIMPYHVPDFPCTLPRWLLPAAGRDGLVLVDGLLHRLHHTDSQQQGGALPSSPARKGIVLTPPAVRAPPSTAYCSARYTSMHMALRGRCFFFSTMMIYDHLFAQPLWRDFSMEDRPPGPPS